MKRIEFIVNNVKGAIAEKTGIREKKLRRAVDEAIDNAEEQSLDCKYKAEQAINSIKDVVDDKHLIAEKLNQYIEYMQDSEGYAKSKVWLEKVKEMLDEDVEVDE